MFFFFHFLVSQNKTLSRKRETYIKKQEKVLYIKKDLSIRISVMYITVKNSGHLVSYRFLVWFSTIHRPIKKGCTIPIAFFFKKTNLKNKFT